MVRTRARRSRAGAHAAAAAGGPARSRSSTRATSRSIWIGARAALDVASLENDDQVRGLPEAGGVARRADAARRSAGAFPTGFRSPRSRPVARGRPAAVAGAARDARPGIADSWRDAGGRRGARRVPRRLNPSATPVTSREFQDRLPGARAAPASRFLRSSARQLETYYRLLATWNTKINLTGLDLDRAVARGARPAADRAAGGGEARARAASRGCSTSAAAAGHRRFRSRWPFPACGC